jgi:putative ABC transport system permease protein
LSSWRLALRIARRDALRAKGRSALVVAMIALPILGVTAADLALRSGELSRAEELTRDLGRADARFTSETAGSPLYQAPGGDSVRYLNEDDWEEDDRSTAEIGDALAAVLPGGTRLLTDESVGAVVHSREGMMATEIRELDAGDPLTDGMLTLLRGHFPEGPDEVAATQAFLDESGLYVGSAFRVRDDGRTYRITGAYELPDALDYGQVIALPGALMPLPEGVADTGMRDARPTFLADVPDGSVSWDMVMAANERGLSALSRSVVLDPPPDDAVPLWEGNGAGGEYSEATEPLFLAGTVTAVSLVVLEICLLAGPAFAVGARRSRRQLGLIGANGGDRRHLRGVMLASGIVLGAAAAALGVAGGIALTMAARPLIEGQAGQRFGAWDFRILELAAIAALAVLVGLLAALVPAVSAARGSVLESLSGRRGVRRAGRVLPLAGVCALVGGAALAIVGGLTLDSPVVVGVGSVIAELGLVALTPLLVGALGRLGRRLPLSGRLALRDAARNRGRTAPAVAAVLAAVAGTVAVSTALASEDAKSEAAYHARLPEGTITLTIHDTQRPGLERARALAERELPIDVRADAYDVKPTDAPGCAEWDMEPACGMAQLVIPEERKCPLWEGEAEAMTAEERRALIDDPRCAEDEWIDGALVQAAGPELLTVLGVADDQVAEAAAALERGEAVVFSDHYVSDSGELALEIYERYPEEWNDDGEPVAEPDLVVTFTAHLVEGDGYGIAPLISPAAAEAAGLTLEDTETYYSTTELPSGDQWQAFEGALNEELGTPPGAYLEDGYESETDVGLLIIALAALVITLGAAGIATGLAQADSEADLATLAAVGAAPRVRRTLSGLQCGLIAAMGVVLGAVSGLIPGIGLRLAQHRSEVGSWEQGIAAGWSAAPRPEFYLELPWTTFAQLIVVVPLAACLLAALLTRSHVPLARRAG